MVHPPSDFMTFVEHQLRVRFIMQFFAETWKEGPTLQELMATFGVGQLELFSTASSFLWASPCTDRHCRPSIRCMNTGFPGIIGFAQTNMWPW